MKTTDKHARLEMIVGLRNNGKTLQEIGDACGITRERVRQLLAGAGYVGKPDLQSKRATEEQKRNQRVRQYAYMRDWQRRNPEKVASYRRRSMSKRRNSDPSFVIVKNLSRRITSVLRGANKCAPTLELLGCTADQFRRYIESKFHPGMTWENYGVMGWHIDHIVSCWKFDLTDPEQQKACFHYTNLQPLWRDANLAKRDHWDSYKAKGGKSHDLRTSV